MGDPLAEIKTTCRFEDSNFSNVAGCVIGVIILTESKNAISLISINQLVLIIISDFEEVFFGNGKLLKIESRKKVGPQLEGGSRSYDGRTCGPRKFKFHFGGSHV